MPETKNTDTRPPWLTYDLTLALAHAVDPALHMLKVDARNPVQGEAMHKVIGFHATNALEQVGWMGPYGLIPAGLDVDIRDTKGYVPVFVVVDPGEYKYWEED